MANWKILADTCTSKGFAREFGVLAGDGTKIRMHYIAAERTGGGDDTVMPRRCMGLGRDRASARASLDDTITTYDASARIIPAR